MNHTEIIKIDLSSIATREELHELIALRLSFPDYYGKNWDAFDECIRDINFSAPATVLQIEGFESLKEHLPREATLLKACIDEFVNETTAVEAVWV